MGLFLIMKRDLYYRPNDCGYTGIKDNAGRYTLEEVAVRFPNMDSPHQDGTSFISEEDAPEFTKACFWDLKLDHLLKQRDEAQSEIARLQAEVERSGVDARTAWKLVEHWMARYDTAHNDALEEAATLVDYYADADYCAMGYPEDGGIAASGTANTIREAIRALKRPAS